MAISRADFCFFIIAMSMRNRTMGITALEDGLFVNLLIFDYLCMYINIYKCPRMFQYKLLYGDWVTGVAVDGG